MLGRMKNFLFGAQVCTFFSLITLPVFLVFYNFGPPLGDDYVYHAGWSLAFTEQFYAGDFYPRWLFDLNLGAGSPVLFFYAPFPFWIHAAFSELLCSSCTLEQSIMLGPCVLLALSGISFYYWARLFTAPFVALLTASFYVFLPYHFMIDLWSRNALGELAIYVWMPVILLGLAKASTSTGYLILASVGYAGLIFSHLPGALLFSPVMLLFAFLRYGFRRQLQVIVFSVILGTGLAAVYIVPALTTQEYISNAFWWDIPHFDPRNWLWLDGRQAYQPHLADKLLLALLTPTLLVAILAGWLLIKEQNRHYIISFVVITLIYAWFLMTYPSILLWEHLPLLRKVQFPWRIGIVVDLSVATMCAIWFERVFARKWLFATTFCLIATALAAYYVHNARSMYWGLMDFRKEINASSVEEARRDIIHRMSAPEYLTPWALDTIPAEEAWDLGLLAERLDEVSEVSIVSGAGNVAIVDKQLDELSIVVDALTPVNLLFRRFYYPGWHLDGGRDLDPLELKPAAVLGLIEAQVPMGTHRLRLKRLPIVQERIGAIISIVSFIACLMLFASVLLKRGYLVRRPKTP